MYNTSLLWWREDVVNFTFIKHSLDFEDSWPVLFCIWNGIVHYGLKGLSRSV